MNDNPSHQAANAVADTGRKDLLEALLATTRRLGGTDGGSAVTELAEAARVHTGARAAAVWRRDGQTGELTLLAPARDPLLRLAAGTGLAGHCAKDGQMLLEVDPGNTVDVAAFTADGHVGQPGAVLSLPLLAGDEVLGVLQLLYESQAGFDPNMVLLAQVLAAEGALAMRHPGAGSTHALHTEVEVARAIQRSTLPEQMPRIPGYDLHSHFQPATYAGGDLLDAVKLADGVFLLVGDATGHGFGPALSAVQMQGMLRVAFRMGANLDSAFLHVNNQLAEDLPEDRFITAFMGILDPVTHTVSYHSAGQGPILHFHAADGRCEWRQPTTFPLGVLALPQVTSSAQVLSMEPGDVLALISDGLYERTNMHHDEFGQDRVGDIVKRGLTSPMADLCQMLLTASGQFADGCAQADDITMILIRRTADTAQPITP